MGSNARLALSHTDPLPTDQVQAWPSRPCVVCPMPPVTPTPSLHPWAPSWKLDIAEFRNGTGLPFLAPRPGADGPPLGAPFCSPAVRPMRLGSHTPPPCDVNTHPLQRMTLKIQTKVLAKMWDNYNSHSTTVLESSLIAS